MDSILKKIYIECDCWDLAHVTRMTYDEEYDIFAFEYVLNKFPFEVATTQFEKNEPEWHKRLVHSWNRFKKYVNGIKLAILGKPIWFAGISGFDSGTAEKLVEFINSNKKRVDSEEANYISGLWWRSKNF